MRSCKRIRKRMGDRIDLSRRHLVRLGSVATGIVALAGVPTLLASNQDAVRRETADLMTGPFLPSGKAWGHRRGLNGDTRTSATGRRPSSATKGSVVVAHWDIVLTTG